MVGISNISSSDGGGKKDRTTGYNFGRPLLPNAGTIISDNSINPTPWTFMAYPDAIERKLASGGFNTGDGSGNPVSTPSRETSINQINFNEQTMTPEAFEDLILEDIGGRELLTLSRHDSLIGITAPKYSPIKNISATLLANSPINIAPNPNSTIDFFDTFSILLSSYIPTDAELNALDAGYKKYYLYYEPSTNSFIINASNIFNNEGVEVEFITFSSLNDDTIYT